MLHLLLHRSLAFFVLDMVAAGQNGGALVCKAAAVSMIHIMDSKGVAYNKQDSWCLHVAKHLRLGICWQLTSSGCHHAYQQ